jgi:hypothetical protein
MDKQTFVDYMKENLPDIKWHSSILENGEVREVHFAEAIAWACEQPDETFHIGKTKIGEWEISTIFSINNLTGNPDQPKHFETMTFYNGVKIKGDSYCSEVNDRYKTLDEAKLGHNFACYCIRQKEEKRKRNVNL